VLGTLAESGASGAADGAPRLFPPLDTAEASSAGEDRDGSLRVIAYGLRVLVHPNGQMDLAREYLPAARSVQTLELPTRLGGGFLFFVVTSSTTLFYRAKTFTGDVEPFARLDFETEQVVAGFDRLYVSGRRPDSLVALDPERGQAIGLGSLPASPGYGKMAFADAWFGAVEVPFRGPLVTFDAGASWRRVPFAATTLETRDGELLFNNENEIVALDRNGVVSHREPTPQDEDNASHVHEVARPLHGAKVELSGMRALKQAILRGFPAADGSFVLASGGSLLRVRALDAKILDSDEHAFAGGGECAALPIGRGYGFSCGDGDETRLFEFVPPFAVRPLRAFSGARYVASSGNGLLVVRGACDARPEQSPGAYCIRGNDGGFRTIRVTGDLGVERVVALSDGRVAVIIPPRLGAPGFISLIDTQGKEQRVALKLPASIPGADGLLERGLWLDGFIETSPGLLSGWVAGSEPFVGVRVALDGNVQAGPVKNSIDRALLSGRHALLVGRTGRTQESSDGGTEWSEVELPSEFDGAREPRGEARLQGCSEIGCVFGGFARVGFTRFDAQRDNPKNKSAEAGQRSDPGSRLRIAKLPEFAHPPQPGGARWLLSCEPTFEQSEPARPLTARARAPAAALARGEDMTVAPWAPLLEQPPPQRAAGELGFDTAADNDSVALRAYAWGDRNADWARTGHLQVQALDRFQVARGIFQSAITHSPWADATAASEAFGFDGSGNPTLWRAVLETGRRAGALVVSSRGLLDLLLFEEGRAVTRVPNVGRVGLGQLSSVAKVGDSWYAASFSENRALMLSKVAAGHVDRLAQYPDSSRESQTATLVRGVHDEALGIWVIAVGWYLFPIDPATGAVKAPLVASAAELAKAPPLCEPDADGFLLTGSPSLEPTLRFARPFEIAARRVEAQLIWSARGLCLRGLAAETETAVGRAAPVARPSSKPSEGVPLTLAERRPDGRRWGFVCNP